MLLPAFDALHIQADTAHAFMRYQWLDLHNHLLRPALEHGYQMSARYRPHLALVDFTYLPPINLADELWLSVHWFPRVLKLPFRQVAIVSRAEHLHNQMAVEAMFWVARHLIKFQVQFFDDVPSALEWLLPEAPTAVRALQVEWHTSIAAATLPAKP